MKKYASGLFYFSFFMIFTIWILVDYLRQSAALNNERQTMYVKQCAVLEFYEYDEEFTLITSQHDTLTISKAYSPGLTLDSLTQLYSDKPSTIYYSEKEVVKLTQDGQTFVEIPYQKIKTQELEMKREHLREGPLAGFYGMLGLSLFILLLTLCIPVYAVWVKRKNEEAILKIPHTQKIGEDLFQYKYMEKEALLYHEINLQLSKSGGTNMITVYFPHPEQLLKPIKMEIDAIQGGKYYNFTHKIISTLNHKKLQQKIESKFV